VDQRAEQNRQAAGRHGSSAARPPTTRALLAPYSTTVGLLTARLGAGGKGRTVAVTLCTAVTVPTHAVSTICAWYLRQGARHRENQSEEQRVGAEWERHSALQYFRRYAFAIEVGNRRKKTGQGKGKGKKGRELWKRGKWI
jgi:hypothetical protein